MFFPSWVYLKVGAPASFLSGHSTRTRLDSDLHSRNSVGYSLNSYMDCFYWIVSMQTIQVLAL